MPLLPKTVKIKDSKTGEVITENIKTGKTIQEVTLDAIDPVKDAEEYARHDHMTLISFVFLLSCPIMVASQNILLRKMRKINSNTLSCYINPFSTVCCFMMLNYAGITFENIYFIINNRPLTLLLFLGTGSVNLFQ